jgi:hypothetical protein
MLYTAVRRIERISGTLHARRNVKHWIHLWISAVIHGDGVLQIKIEANGPGCPGEQNRPDFRLCKVLVFGSAQSL